MNGERWKDIPGYEGRYRVSNMGRVISLPSVMAGTRIMKGSKNSDGYKIVCLSHDGKRDAKGKRRGVTARVHRLVLLAFVGPCPKGMESRHLNGIKTDNRLSNLEWAAPAVNNRDRHKHGTMPKGSAIIFSKLTAEKVRSIRRRLKRGHRPERIAKRFGVDRRSITMIRDGETWRWLK
jgi:hypothetical protein